MNTERLKTSSSLQHEVFLTQEIYNKYSCRPSFVEFLEKHLGSNKDRQTTGHNKHDDKNEDLPMESITEGHKMNKGTNNSGAERNGSHGVPACLGSAMGFPCVSKISIESQELFLKVLEILRSSQLAKVDLQEMKAVQDIKNTVLIEQDEYQKFVHHHAKNNHHLYNFVQPDIWDTFKSEVEGKFKESVFKYPRHYSLQETIGLAVGAVFKSDAVLTFEQTLLQVGNVAKLCLPENTGIMLSDVSTNPDEKARVMTSAAMKSNSPKVVSEDPIALSLAKKHKADIVISSSGLNTLLNNQPPDYRRQWQLPITVQRLQGNQDKSLAHKVVFIDKPLPPQQVNPREVNMKFYKHVFRKLVCQKPGGENTATDDNSARDTNSTVKTAEGSHSTGLERERKTFEMDETDSVKGKRRVSQEGDEIAAIKKSKVTDSSEKESVSASKTEGQKFFVYNLWRFGKLKVLIRCSVDAYRTEPNKEKCYTFFSVLPKLEYQPNFGHEKLTYSEAARLWLHGYIRPNTKLICGRINVYSSELLRIDELYINDILQQGTGFHPAQGMKIVFQVFQALKRLSEGKFILSHKSGEIHGCLYKSIQANSSSLKSSCDLHKTRTPVIVNYSEAEIPWVPIDCNMFMPWQVRERRIPCTFPPVPAKELELMAKKAKEAAVKGTGKNKKKKKKGKKKGKGKGPAPTAASVSEQAKTSRNDRRTVNKEKLFASFYDTQTVEKESEVFAVSRRASGPVSYDDLDF